jgi:hypothetical protein
MGSEPNGLVSVFASESAMQVQPDAPIADRPRPEHVSVGEWTLSTIGVLSLAAALAFTFFSGPLDQRILRQAGTGAGSVAVADTLFQGPIVEGRSASACSKDAIRNLTTALIDTNRFAQAADELKQIDERCALFR